MVTHEPRCGFSPPSGSGVLIARVSDKSLSSPSPSGVCELDALHSAAEDIMHFDASANLNPSVASTLQKDTHVIPKPRTVGSAAALARDAEALSNGASPSFAQPFQLPVDSRQSAYAFPVMSATSATFLSHSSSNSSAGTAGAPAGRVRALARIKAQAAERTRRKTSEERRRRTLIDSDSSESAKGSAASSASLSSSPSGESAESSSLSEHTSGVDTPERSVESSAESDLQGDSLAADSSSETSEASSFSDTRTSDDSDADFRGSEPVRPAARSDVRSRIRVAAGRRSGGRPGKFGRKVRTPPGGAPGRNSHETPEWKAQSRGREPADDSSTRSQSTSQSSSATVTSSDATTESSETSLDSTSGETGDSDVSAKENGPRAPRRFPLLYGHPAEPSSASASSLSSPRPSRQPRRRRLVRTPQRSAFLRSLSHRRRAPALPRKFPSCSFGSHPSGQPSSLMRARSSASTFSQASLRVRSAILVPHLAQTERRRSQRGVPALRLLALSREDPVTDMPTGETANRAGQKSKQPGKPGGWMRLFRPLFDLRPSDPNHSTPWSSSSVRSSSERSSSERSSSDDLSSSSEADARETERTKGRDASSAERRPSRTADTKTRKARGVVTPFEESGSSEAGARHVGVSVAGETGDASARVAKPVEAAKTSLGYRFPKEQDPTRTGSDGGMARHSRGKATSQLRADSPQSACAPLQSFSSSRSQSSSSDYSRASSPGSPRRQSEKRQSDSQESARTPRRTTRGDSKTQATSLFDLLRFVSFRTSKSREKKQRSSLSSSPSSRRTIQVEKQLSATEQASAATACGEVLAVAPEKGNRDDGKKIRFRGQHSPPKRSPREDEESHFARGRGEEERPKTASSEVGEATRKMTRAQQEATEKASTDVDRKEESLHETRRALKTSNSRQGPEIENRDPSGCRSDSRQTVASSLTRSSCVPASSTSAPIDLLAASSRASENLPDEKGEDAQTPAACPSLASHLSTESDTVSPVIPRRENKESLAGQRRRSTTEDPETSDPSSAIALQSKGANNENDGFSPSQEKGVSAARESLSFAPGGRGESVETRKGPAPAKEAATDLRGVFQMHASLESLASGTTASPSPSTSISSSAFSAYLGGSFQAGSGGLTSSLGTDEEAERKVEERERETGSQERIVGASCAPLATSLNCKANLPAEGSLPACSPDRPKSDCRTNEASCGASSATSSSSSSSCSSPPPYSSSSFSSCHSSSSFSSPPSFLSSSSSSSPSPSCPSSSSSSSPLPSCSPSSSSSSSSSSPLLSSSPPVCSSFPVVSQGVRLPSFDSEKSSSSSVSSLASRACLREGRQRMPSSKFRWVDLDGLPLTSQVAFDDLAQAVRRRACDGRLAGACCCCIGCRTDTAPTSPASVGPHKDGSCTCFCGTCCCVDRSSPPAGNPQKTPASPSSCASKQAPLDFSFLFDMREGGGLSASGAAGASASAVASFLATRLPSFHAGLPPARLAELQASAAARLAASMASKAALAARVLVHAPANQLVIPSVDLFVDHRKLRSLMAVPKRSVTEQVMRLLQRLPRFTLPLYESFLLEQVCEDPVLHPRLQGLEVPFRLLTHDFVFLGSYAYFADLPPWSRPPIRLLRIYKFQQLQLVDSGESRADASPVHGDRHAAFVEPSRLVGERGWRARRSLDARLQSRGSEVPTESSASSGFGSEVRESSDARTLSAVEGTEGVGHCEGASLRRQSAGDSRLDSGSSAEGRFRRRGCDSGEGQERDMGGSLGLQEEDRGSSFQSVGARPRGGTYAAPRYGARPDDLEAEHLQGLALYNLKLLMRDFEETLEVVELHYGEMFFIEGDVFAYFRGLTEFMDSQGFQLETIKCRRKDGPPIALRPQDPAGASVGWDGDRDRWGLGRGDARRRGAARRGDRGAKEMPARSCRKPCGVCCRCVAKKEASSTFCETEESGESEESDGQERDERRLARRRQSTAGREGDSPASSDEEQGGWRRRRHQLQGLSHETDGACRSWRQRRGRTSRERRQGFEGATAAFRLQGARRGRRASDSETEDDGAGDETDDEDVDGFVRSRTIVDEVYGEKDEGGIGSGLARTFTNLVKALDASRRRRTDVFVDGAGSALFSGGSSPASASRSFSRSGNITEEGIGMRGSAKVAIHSVTFKKKPPSLFRASPQFEETERPARRERPTDPYVAPDGRGETADRGGRGGGDREGEWGEGQGREARGSGVRGGEARTSFLGFLLGEDEFDADEDPLAFLDSAWY
ncbi:hypothetical protein TGVAND_211600 [Toxoplasma gondii VAND]|uniref:Uncharacterized protein n=1 Tax=Toxoplasma gondii VAND TaxID=933077 RepID=A0A086PHQ1_TOXGO|nr:hypothetical protein TGVAND_211600 [Toxoplasma gondii VAND]